MKKLLIAFILLCTCTAILCTIMLNDITTDSLGETEGIPTKEEEDIKDMPLSGGWSLHFTEKEYELNGEKEKAVFEMILKKDVILNYNPVACLGIKNTKDNNEFYQSKPREYSHFNVQST